MLQKRSDLELVEAIRQEPAHLRQLAARTGLVPSTAMRILKALQQEGIVDYVREGRNTVYALKETLEAQAFLLMAEEYKLLKLAQKPLLRQIIKDLQFQTNGELIILFGSHARGAATAASDIDIYIETADEQLKKVLQRISPKLSIKIGAFEKDSPLGKEIIKTHVIVQNAERFYRLAK